MTNPIQPDPVPVPDIPEARAGGGEAVEYVFGLMSRAEASRFEARLARDPALRLEVGHLRELAQSAREWALEPPPGAERLDVIGPELIRRVTVEGRARAARGTAGLRGLARGCRRFLSAPPWRMFRNETWRAGFTWGLTLAIVAVSFGVIWWSIRHREDPGPGQNFAIGEKQVFRVNDPSFPPP